jgi:hypothetical protein
MENPEYVAMLQERASLQIELSNNRYLFFDEDFSAGPHGGGGSMTGDGYGGGFTQINPVQDANQEMWDGLLGVANSLIRNDMKPN